MYGQGYKKYETIAEKQARAARSVARMKKKNAQLAPIQVTGRKLAITWWGMAWTENLERYADFANRISRGRSYLRQGAVLDLQIEPGKVTGLVQGSRVKPYQVEIHIQPLKPAVWMAITQACSGNIHSLQDLVSGKFPRNLAELFTASGTGLFPALREIAFNCSCPDWADMCKHVAAILYGIGVRFDEDPTLFFRLRQVDIDELITDALNQTSDSLLDRLVHKSRRSLDHDDLSGLFGIDFVDAIPSPPAPTTIESTVSGSVGTKGLVVPIGPEPIVSGPTGPVVPKPSVSGKTRARTRATPAAANKTATPTAPAIPTATATPRQPAAPAVSTIPATPAVPAAPAATIKKRGRPRKVNPESTDI